VGHVVGAEAAPSIARLLSDRRWWVRSAAKDALRGMGSDAVPSLLALLTHDDLFARNGAAEVLQDVGFVDFLALDNPRSPLLERIYEAGGERFREAATARAAAAQPKDGAQAA
jgi:HEAT repeat protein